MGADAEGVQKQKRQEPEQPEEKRQLEQPQFYPPQSSSRDAPLPWDPSLEHQEQQEETPVSTRPQPAWHSGHAPPRQREVADDDVPGRNELRPLRRSRTVPVKAEKQRNCLCCQVLQALAIMAAITLAVYLFLGACMSVLTYVFFAETGADLGTAHRQQAEPWAEPPDLQLQSLLRERKAHRPSAVTGAAFLAANGALNRQAAGGAQDQQQQQLHSVQHLKDVTKGVQQPALMQHSQYVQDQPQLHAVQKVSTAVLATGAQARDRSRRAPETELARLRREAAAVRWRRA